MTHLQLLDIVKQTLPQFDLRDTTHLIKAEKILKAYQKTNSDLQLNDIENFIIFYKNNENKYVSILQDENLQKILKNEDFILDTSQTDLNSQSLEVKEEFGTEFKENISNFIQLNVKKNQWKNLRNFYNKYSEIINFETKDQLINLLTSKNNLVRSIIPNTKQYHLLTNEYKHAIDWNFYALQSDIDAAYFNEEILDINNDVSNHQHTDLRSKAYLGRILIALGHFEAYSEELKRILAKNTKIAEKWVRYNIEDVPKRKGIKPPKSVKKDYGATAEWVFLTLFYGLFGLAVYFLKPKLNNFFWVLVVFEGILLLIFNKSFNKNYEEESKEKQKSTRRTLKKIAFKLVVLQIYSLAIGLCLAIVGGLIATVVFTGGVGGGVIAIIVLIIRVALKKKG